VNATGALPGAATPVASAVAAPVPSAAASVAKAWVPQAPAAPVVEASGLAGYTDVTLSSLGVELIVPDGLAAKRAPNRISTEDGSASVEFTELPPSRSLAELYAAATDKPASGRSISYKKQKDDWFVVSGHAGAAIYYEKTARLAGRNLRFSFEFPAAQRKDYDEDTAYMASSFRALGAPAPELPKGRCSADGDCPKGYHCPPNGFCTINWGD
jgi:hypothetical protein